MPKKKKLPMPNNLDETVAILIEYMDNSTVASFKAIDEETAKLGGQGIRNGWGLWTGSPLKDYFNSIDIDHPDDMSAIVLTSLHRKLNNKDIDLPG